MLDDNKRKIDYMRVAVTDRCNLRCVYCMPEKGIEQLPAEEILSFEEMLRVISCASRLGITKIRITGGEPLVRRDLSDFIRKIKLLSIEEVSMTTNGTLLAEHLDELAAAGLDRVNISLDTLDKEKYKKITRGGDLDKVFKGINLAISKGLNPIKLNVVVSKEFNLSEIVDFIRFGEQMNLDVRFIELMPIGEARAFSRVSNDEVLQIAKQYTDLKPYGGVKGSGPAVYYKTSSGKGSLGFISPLSHGFCSNCNRIRLTPEGYLKLCLHWHSGVDLKKILRSSAGDMELLTVMKQAIKNKPYRHGFDSNCVSDFRIMSQIGG